MGTFNFKTTAVYGLLSFNVTTDVNGVKVSLMLSRVERLYHQCISLTSLINVMRVPDLDTILMTS